MKVAPSLGGPEKQASFTTPKPLKMSDHAYISAGTPYGYLPPH